MSDYKAKPFEFYCDISNGHDEILARQCLVSGDFQYIKDPMTIYEHRAILEYMTWVIDFKRPDSLKILNDGYLDNLKYIFYNLNDGEYDIDIFNKVFDGFINGCDVLLLKYNDGSCDSTVYKTSTNEYIYHYDLVFDLEVLKNHLLQYNCNVTICKSIDEFNDLLESTE